MGLPSLKQLELQQDAASSKFLKNTGREAALAWASLAQRFPASSVLAREGAGCGSALT